MINVDELTIGNKIWKADNYITDTTMRLYVVTARFFSDLCANGQSFLLNFFPIPICDEMLLGIGFTQSRNKNVFSMGVKGYNQIQLHKSISGEEYYLRLGSFKGEKIQNLHQLENLLSILGETFWLRRKFIETIEVRKDTTKQIETIA